MTLRSVAIALKIPDNEAYTAAATLRRLGIDVTAVERADVWQFEDERDDRELVRQIERTETLFNPNKHVLHLLDTNGPRNGEVWIEQRTGAAENPVPRRYAAWRLFKGAAPADARTVREAADRLFCNPAIERARTE